MSTQTETTTAHKAEGEEDRMTGSTRNGEHDLQEKNGAVAINHDEVKPEYSGGWRLWSVMVTLYLNTLLAALDVVSIHLLISISAGDNRFLTDLIL